MNIWTQKSRNGRLKIKLLKGRPDGQKRLDWLLDRKERPTKSETNGEIEKFFLKWYEKN